MGFRPVLLNQWESVHERLVGRVRCVMDPARILSLVKYLGLCVCRIARRQRTR